MVEMWSSVHSPSHGYGPESSSQTRCDDPSLVVSDFEDEDKEEDAMYDAATSQSSYGKKVMS